MLVSTDYTFGSDEISQRVHGAKADGTPVDETLVFGHDGHGSVRVLYDLSVTGANLIEQVLTFAAYGSMLAVHNATGALVGTNESFAKTSFGYSGEHFDAKAQQQYLRARFYNPANGQFNRLDPFAGNMQDPQSLHKYAYVHGDPIGGIDPTGRSFVASISVSVSIGIVAGGIGAGIAAYGSGYDVDDPEFWIAVGFGALGGALIGMSIGAGLGIGLGAAGAFSPFLGLAALGTVLLAVAVGYTARPTYAIETQKIADALQLIKNTPGYSAEYDLMSGSDFEFRVENESFFSDLFGDKWAYVRPWQNDRITLKPDAFLLPTPYLATLLVHESVHTHQLPPISLFPSLRESAAYQRQSDFMRAIGYAGNGRDLNDKLIADGYGSASSSSKVQNWVSDQREGMKEEYTTNPAVI